MDRRILLAAALVVLPVPLGTAQAEVVASFEDEVSAFALPLFEPEETVVGAAGAEMYLVAQGTPRRARYEPRGGSSTTTKSTETAIVPAPPRYDATRYQPRRSGRPPSPHRSHSSSPSWGGSTQLHGGFFRSEATQQTGGLVGFRAGPRFGQHFSLGVASDWRWKTESVSEVVGESESVGGQSVVVRREIARAYSHHVPLMGYAELTAGSRLPISPYIGGGGGYQWLFLNGEDFVTGDRYNATFGNWGWQAWAGLTLRLSHTVHLNGEAFYNNATLERTTRTTDGSLIREQVDMEGVGGRFGLSFGLF